MPMYDRQCPMCGKQYIDVLEPVYAVHTCSCGAFTERAWLTRMPTVIGDEIDVTIEHAFPEPVRFRSRTEMARAIKAQGLTPRVEHLGNPATGSDKSPHTSRWV